MHHPHATTKLERERPVLTAAWRNLVLLSFSASPEVLAPHVPPGVELDRFDGRPLVSIVGFTFLDSKLWGLRAPGYRRFAEVNLRFYVKRTVAGRTRRGVVFIREIAPKRCLALLAGILYQEKYLVRPMRTAHDPEGQSPPGEAIRYEWRDRDAWSRVGARVDGPFALPRPGSLEEFIIEHYWAYTLCRRGCLEYRVVHPPWRVAAASEVIWECDVAATFGPKLGEHLSRPPFHAMLADGSDVSVFRAKALRP